MTWWVLMATLGAALLATGVIAWLLIVSSEDADAAPTHASHWTSVLINQGEHRGRALCGKWVTREEITTEVPTCADCREQIRLLHGE